MNEKKLKFYLSFPITGRELKDVKVMVDETKYMGRGMICREGLNGK